VNTEIKLPPGYYVQYGGQFENLQSAKARLMVAVPLALFLILILYFAFGSKRSFNGVFSNTTFCSGRVLFLWMRGLPFSISAGVGFIALFGIAVLNGIVLIEHFKELKHQGMMNSY
jgi:cobalt-zinc-cadmium resistance protein CzcA